MDASRDASYDISHLLGMVRRHWWLVALLTLAGVAAAYQYTGMQPEVYESSTSVLVQPTGAGQDTNVVGGRTKGDINLDTEAQLVRSTAVAGDAAKLLRTTAAPDSLAARVSVEVPPNTSVLVVTYAAGDPRAAQAGSHAFAEAYLRNREETARGELAGQITTVETKLKQLNAALGQINNRLATLRQDSSDRANLDSQRATITSQINTLAGRLNQLSTTTVSAGKIIRDANLPKRPSKPVLPLNLGSGAAAGMLFGVAAALVRERLDRRVRRPADLVRRCDVAVLAALPPRERLRFDDVFPAFGAGGRVFHRLRNEVVAAAGPAGGGGGAHVVVVAGASRGSASTVVAANLAAAFARTGSPTVLVCAHLPDSLTEVAPVTRLLGVRAVPGLSDVLAGRVPLPAAVQRTPRQPRLSVLTTGGTASAGGLLQARALRDALDMLRRRARYVVIEAPSTSTSADAQSVASLADAALVAVELRRTRYAEVTDAVEQLRRVGTRVLGAVVLPHLVRHRDELPGALAEYRADEVDLYDGEPDDVEPYAADADLYGGGHYDRDRYDGEPFDAHEETAGPVDGEPIDAEIVDEVDGLDDATVVMPCATVRRSPGPRPTDVPRAQLPSRVVDRRGPAADVPGVETAVLALTGIDLNGIDGARSTGGAAPKPDLDATAGSVDETGTPEDGPSPVSADATPAGRDR